MMTMEIMRIIGGGGEKEEAERDYAAVMARGFDVKEDFNSIIFLGFPFLTGCLLL